LLPLLNGTFVPKPTDGVALSPQFVTFFRRMARASIALYMDRGQTPRMALSIRALPTGDATGTVTLFHGDRTTRLVPGAEAQSVSWPPSGGSSARLTVSSGGRDQEIARADGAWALFRVMAQETSSEGTGRTRVLTFSGAAPVALELTAPGVGPVVQRGALQGQACVSQVTQ